MNDVIKNLGRAAGNMRVPKGNSGFLGTMIVVTDWCATITLIGGGFVAFSKLILDLKNGRK